MAPHLARVIRTYSLPVVEFDHLKTFQRTLQLQADMQIGKPAREWDVHWITNSDALAHLVRQHGLISMAAGKVGMRPADFTFALYQGDLKVVSASGLAS